jgi:hypothetical protein
VTNNLAGYMRKEIHPAPLNLAWRPVQRLDDELLPDCSSFVKRQIRSA